MTINFVSDEVLDENINIMEQLGAKLVTPHKQDNSWYERGELPPVGSTVEKKYKSATIWTEIKIVAAGNQLVIFGYPAGDESVGEWSDYEFRPLRTEREKAIDEMVSGYQSAKGDKPVHPRVRVFAEYLYDAGYRKVNP